MVHWCPCCCIGPCVVIAGPHFDPAVVPGSWSSVTAAIASSLSLASGQEWEATPGNSYWRDGDFFMDVWCCLMIFATFLLWLWMFSFDADFTTARMCLENGGRDLDVTIRCCLCGPVLPLCRSEFVCAKLEEGPIYLGLCPALSETCRWLMACWWLWGLQATDFSSVQTISNYSRGGSKLAIFNLEGWYQATYNCQNLGGVCP
jgi:hypothetical protein